MTELVLVIAVASLGLVAAGILARWILAREWGTAVMRRVSDELRDATVAGAARHERSIAAAAAAIAGALFLLYGFVRARESFDPTRTTTELAAWSTLAFVVGAAAALAARRASMWVTLRSGVRSAAALSRSLNHGLEVALRGGAIVGIVAVSSALLGIAALLVALLLARSPSDAAFMVEAAPKLPTALVAYALGGSVVAFIGRDPRDAAASALFEATAAEGVATLIVGAMVCFANPVRVAGGAGVLGFLIFPLAVRAFGIIASIIGVLSVKTDGKENPVSALHRGMRATAVLALLGFAGGAYWLLGRYWLPLFLCGAVGVTAALALVWICPEPRAPRAGVASALEATSKPLGVIAVAVLASYELGEHSGLAQAGSLGAAIAATGALVMAPYFLALRATGTIAGDAIVILERAGEPLEPKADGLRRAAARGSALARGYSVGATALVAFALFAAYVAQVSSYRCSAWAEMNRLPSAPFGALLAECRASMNTLDSAPLSAPALFVGGLAGAALVVGFLAMSLKPHARRSAIDGVLVAALLVGVGVVFKHGLGVGGEAVAALLVTSSVAGTAVSIFLEALAIDQRERELWGYVPVIPVITFALVIAPLFA